MFIGLEIITNTAVSKKRTHAHSIQEAVLSIQAQSTKPTSSHFIRAFADAGRTERAADERNVGEVVFVWKRQMMTLHQPSFLSTGITLTALV